MRKRKSHHTTCISHIHTHTQIYTHKAQYTCWSALAQCTITHALECRYTIAHKFYAHIHTHTHSIRAQSHTRKATYRTHNWGNTHCSSIPPSNSLLENALVVHIPSSKLSVLLIDSLNRFSQCRSRNWEDCSVIQEQYLVCVWRREANRGLWLNNRYDNNAPRHEGRSSLQDHAHQKSDVVRFELVQCSLLSG